MEEIPFVSTAAPIVSLELCKYFSHFNDRLGRQMALSLLWTVYASGLLISGGGRNTEGLRWQALMLFGIAVGKVFPYDLSFLFQRHVSAIGN